DGHWLRQFDAAAVDGERDHAMALQRSCAACFGSLASKIAEMTATPRAPASMHVRAFVEVMPPMAMTGIFTTFAISAISSTPATGPFWCDADGKIVPATT